LPDGRYDHFKGEGAMAEDIVIFNTNTWVAEVIYYVVSLLVLFVLLIGKVFVDTRNSRFLHIFYTLFVFGIAAIQFCLAVHGTSFLKGFLHINYDIDYSALLLVVLFRNVPFFS
jgi:hypothetical protein